MEALVLMVPSQPFGRFCGPWLCGVSESRATSGRSGSKVLIDIPQGHPLISTKSNSPNVEKLPILQMLTKANAASGNNGEYLLKLIFPCRYWDSDYACTPYNWYDAAM